MKFHILISITKGMQSFDEEVKEYFSENYPDLPQECLEGSKLYRDLVKQIFEDLNHALAEKDTLQDLENSLYEEMCFGIGYQQLINDLCQQVNRLNVGNGSILRINDIQLKPNLYCKLMLEVIPNATL